MPNALPSCMLGSSAIQRFTHQHRGVLVVPFVVAYLALSVFATRAAVDALAHGVEPIEATSSGAPTPDSALSLGGEPSSVTDAGNELCVCF